MKRRSAPIILNVAISLNNLGYVLKAQGDLEGAKALYERALAIDEAAFGPNHPNVAIGLNNLGHVLRRKATLKAQRHSTSAHWR